MKNTRHPLVAALLSSAVLLTACGGGGGSDSGTPTPPALKLTGNGIKGPVYDATVTVWSYATTPPTPVATCGNTNQTGDYNCTLPGGSTGPFEVRLSGGVFCSDESPVLVGPAGGTSCGGGATVKTGGTGENALSTIVLQTTNGELASAPITPFTTAAAKEAISTGNVDTFVTTYAAIATVYGIDTNPTTKVDFTDSNSRAVALLAEMGASDAPVTTLISNIQSGSNPVTGDPEPISEAVKTQAPVADSSTPTTGLEVTTGNGEGGTITGGTAGGGGATN